jgi:hypothetical protein
MVVGSNDFCDPDCCSALFLSSFHHAPKSRKDVLEIFKDGSNPTPHLKFQLFMKERKMLAKLVLTFVLIFILLYVLKPSIQRHFNHCWRTCRNWVNENEHAIILEGFTEEVLDLPPIKKEKAPCSHYHRLYESVKKKSRGCYGHAERDGIDELNSNCFWYQGTLICP